MQTTGKIKSKNLIDAFFSKKNGKKSPGISFAGLLSGLNPVKKGKSKTNKLKRESGVDPAVQALAMHMQASGEIRNVSLKTGKTARKTESAGKAKKTVHPKLSATHDQNFLKRAAENSDKTLKKAAPLIRLNRTIKIKPDERVDKGSEKTGNAEKKPDTDIVSTMTKVEKNDPEIAGILKNFKAENVPVKKSASATVVPLQVKSSTDSPEQPGIQIQKPESQNSGVQTAANDGRPQQNPGNKNSKQHPVPEIHQTKRDENARGFMHVVDRNPNLPEIKIEKPGVIVRQIVELYRNSTVKDTDLTRFRLIDKTFGMMEIQFHKEANGESARIVVESESGKQHILKLLPAIQNGLQEQGIAFSKLNVDIGQFKHSGQSAQEEMVDAHEQSDTRRTDGEKQERVKKSDDSKTGSRYFGYNTIEITV